MATWTGSLNGDLNNPVNWGINPSIWTGAIIGEDINISTSSNCPSYGWCYPTNVSVSSSSSILGGTWYLTSDNSNVVLYGNANSTTFISTSDIYYQIDGNVAGVTFSALSETKPSYFEINGNVVSHMTSTNFITEYNTIFEINGNVLNSLQSTIFTTKKADFIINGLLENSSIISSEESIFNINGLINSSNIHSLSSTIDIIGSVNSTSITATSDLKVYVEGIIENSSVYGYGENSFLMFGGTIDSGYFDIPIVANSGAVITGGIFDSDVTSENMTISSSPVFNGNINGGAILVNDGTFNGNIMSENSTINNGIFNGNVDLYEPFIVNNGTFNGNIAFNGDYHSGYTTDIYGGTFNGGFIMEQIICFADLSAMNCNNVTGIQMMGSVLFNDRSGVNASGAFCE